MQMIEQIYNSLSTGEKETNHFENAENSRLFNAVYNKYIERQDFDEVWNGYMDLCELIGAERKHAFEVGYKTAMQLFTEVFANTLIQTTKKGK